MGTFNGPDTILSMDGMMGKKTEKAAVLMSFIFGCGVKGGGEGKLDKYKEMSQ